MDATTWSPSGPRLPDNLHHEILSCATNLVCRLIGKGGTTVQCIQLFTGAVIEVNQATDPAIIRVVGSSSLSVRLAASMIQDIIESKFKGFTLLRELVQAHEQSSTQRDQFVYAPGFGLMPQRRVGCRMAKRIKFSDANLRTRKKNQLRSSSIKQIQFPENQKLSSLLQQGRKPRVLPREKNVSSS